MTPRQPSCVGQTREAEAATDKTSLVRMFSSSFSYDFNLFIYLWDIPLLKYIYYTAICFFFFLHLSVWLDYILFIACLFSFSFYLIAYASVYLLLYCSWSSFIYLFILYIYLFIFALVLFIILFILSFSFVHSVFPFICQFQCCSLIYGIIVFLTLLSVVAVFCFGFYSFFVLLIFFWSIV